MVPGSVWGSGFQALRLGPIGATEHDRTFDIPMHAGDGPYPTVVSCYGGPHVQFVANSWGMTVDLRAQALRSKGFLVLKVDNRGSNRRLDDTVECVLCVE